AADRRDLHRLHAAVGHRGLARPRRHVERPRPGPAHDRAGAAMSAAELASGKGAADENFPVASLLIAPEHRAPIMAFYRVARLADDVADNASASAALKLKRLAEIEASLTGKSEA